MFKKGDLIQAKPEFLDSNETLDDTVGIVYEYNPSNDYLKVGVLNPEDYAFPPIFNGRGACYEIVPLDSDRAKEINSMLKNNNRR